jgi:hypothetical protein
MASRFTMDVCILGTGTTEKAIARSPAQRERKLDLDIKDDAALKSARLSSAGGPSGR